MQLRHEPEPPATTAASQGVLAQPRVYLGPSQILLLAVWFGVLTGVGELAVVAVRTFCLHDPVRELPELLWMAPVADVLLLALAGVLLAFGAWLRLGIGSLRLVTFVYLALATATLLYYILALPGYTKILLALGLATQGSHIFARRPSLLGRLIAWTTGWVRPWKQPRSRTDSRPPAWGDIMDRRQVLTASAGVLTGLAAGCYGWDWLRERRALAALPPGAPGRPNVLFLVLDTVRAESLSLHGYKRVTTPNLDRLARQGVSFRRAIAPAPWTLTSHAAMFTGRRASETGADYGVAYDGRYPTLAEALSSQGYHTAGFIGNNHFLCPAYGLHRGFTHFVCHGTSLEQIFESSALARGVSDNPQVRSFLHCHQLLGRNSAATLNHDLVEWLQTRDASRPFFAFVNYFDAHDPYLPSREAAGTFGSRAPRNPRIDCYSSYSPDELDSLRSAYDECILGLDAEVGRLLARLQGAGHLENTVVVITSDHGEHFGEHNLMAHWWSLYSQLVHVPLIIIPPSHAPAGEVVSQAVSLRDLPATIFDLVGLRESQSIPGTSLAGFWKARRAIRESLAVPVLSEVNPPPFGLPRHYPITRGPMKSLVWRDFHYIRNGDASEELYHKVEDTHEENNLASSAAGQAVVKRMRTILDTDRLS
jgi:arylsulfatase A-like enzyme